MIVIKCVISNDLAFWLWKWRHYRMHLSLTPLLQLHPQILTLSFLLHQVLFSIEKTSDSYTYALPNIFHHSAIKYAFILLSQISRRMCLLMGVDLATLPCIALFWGMGEQVLCYFVQSSLDWRMLTAISLVSSQVQKIGK